MTMLRLLLLSAVVLLQSCVGGSLGEPPSIRSNSNDVGDVELVLDPVNVWYEKNTSESVQVEVDGRAFYVRKRHSGGVFEQAWAQAGLFWHSRGKKVFLTIVTFGPKVTIHEVSIWAGKNYGLLSKARNFQFTPGISKLDTRETSSAAFEMNSSLLQAVADAETAQMVIKTSRGNLKMGLDVMSGDTEADLRRSARYLFTSFADKVKAAQQ
ncbi:hypothetical protein NQX30_02320 [Candidatus Persebacteraceae bacterium Df01]|jgi:hypothetical protein|uniref:DUF4468 domain-containing protein n=1 Tax=Candidatus Doriopsillibacter californiensis TaxID=2970740 RepID=A0ABT7QL29_9GAMM|nr:hypothetical protein [Candidatus Persebacteraceae bacterium Df01]